MMATMTKNNGELVKINLSGAICSAASINLISMPNSLAVVFHPACRLVLLCRKLLDLKCKPNALGPVQCFKDCKMIQASVAALSIGRKIDDGHVMSLAEQAFVECGHDKTNVSQIATA